jgi:uncharacterized protein (DUF488 family)
MPDKEVTLTIYTIGHGNAPAESIVALLRQHQISQLVDVRSMPYSQYNPQFNRELFRKTLENAGIQYIFAGKQLGGRPEDRTVYKAEEMPDGDTERERFLNLVDYDEVARRSWYLEGIDRLIEIAGQARTAIMCSEEDPRMCHRSRLITPTLLGLNVAVLHIRKSGEVEQAVVEPKQLSLF